MIGMLSVHVIATPGLFNEGGAGVSQSLSFQFTSRSLTQHWDIQTVGGIRGNRLVCVCARVFVYVCVRVCAQVQREGMCMGL